MVQQRSTTVSSVQCAEPSIQSIASRVQSPVQFSIKRPESKVQHPESTIQSPPSRVQHLESCIQSPTSRFQRLELSVQSPASRVQHPESSVQHLDPQFRNSGLSFLKESRTKTGAAVSNKYQIQWKKGTCCRENLESATVGVL